MSSTVRVQRWFRSPTDLAATAGELSRHAREFGFTFVGDDDDLKQECASLPPVPPLIPLGEAAVAGRLKNARIGSTGSDIDCDDSGRSSAELPPTRTYGGVIMVNSGDPGGEGVCASEDEDKLLRLFGGDGGDSDSVSAEEEDEGECGGVRRGESDCAVLLAPLPSSMLRSLNSGGRVSARESSCGSGPDSSEAREGLQSLDSSDAPRQERHEHEQRRSPRALRQDSETVSEVTGAETSPRPPPLPIDSSDVAEATSRDESEPGAVPKKTRHRKSESPRKAVRRRRERRSSSSGASKKHRKRSTSTCSTTSSTCSNSSARHHHHKHHHKHHKHRRRSPAPSTAEEPPPTPRVNPIFVWIKQDNTRIVEVLCEDYDKRNRIRLTKTAHGWRAMPRTERLACGAVGDPLLPVNLPRPTTPPAPLVTAASATSTTDGHGEALAAEEQCDEQATDSAPVDHNTSLVPDALPDCPFSKDGTVKVDETKEEELEDAELEEVEEIERVSPVKEVIDIDDDTEKYDGDEEGSGLPVGDEVADNEVDGNDDVENKHSGSDHNDDDHVDSEHIEHDVADSENMDELIDSGHVSEQGDVEPVSDHGDGDLGMEDDIEFQTESEQANEHIQHVDDNKHVDDDHVDECFEEEHHDDAVSVNEHEILMDEVEKDDKSLVPDELLDDEVSSFHETLDGPLIEEHHEVQKDEDNIVEKEEADSLEIIEHELGDHESSEHESPECESLAMETEDEKYASFVDSACVEEPEEANLETDACDNVLDDEDEAAIEGEEDEEDTAPTDLSLPKNRAADQDIPVNCKNIPRNISTVIPPVVPSPQPRTSPSSYPPVTPAHQSKPLHTSKFLESLLSSPRKCHEILRRPSPESEKGPAPLDLGVSPANRGAGSPTVSCSDESRKISRPAKEPAEGEPKAKCLKVEDITLKNLLSRQPDAAQHAAELDLSLTCKKDDLGDSGRKSRLLELLTSEPSPLSISPSPPLDASAQLKKVLSDPELVVPDPLLVPRNRLQELISNPGKEIPRLLTCRPELRLPDALAYPSLVQDPDLLVISLTHLQSLLQKSEKEKSIKEAEHVGYNNLGNILDWQVYQQQFSAKEFAKELDSQIKVQQQRHHEQQRQHHLQQQQSQQEMDAATAAALNQMLWLPYLTQLEAAATACGNPQDFLNILNTVFPPTYSQSEQSIPPPPPSHLYGSLSPSMFNLHPNDFKNQMEFQNALMLWHSAMTQAANASALNNNNNTSTSNNNHRSTKTSSNNVSKNVSPTNGRYSSQNSRKYNSSSSARTSPITPNSFHSPQPPPSPQLRTPSNHISASASSAAYLAAANSNNSALSGTNSVNSASVGYPLSSQLHQQYNIQRNRQSNSANTNPATKSSKVDSLLDAKVNGGRSVSCKSLLNLLSGPQSFQESAAMQQSHQHSMLNHSSTLSRQQQQQHSHLLAALGKPSANSSLTQNSISVSKSMHQPPSPLDLSGVTKKTSVPKLKVKEHLIDPAHTPKLLKADPSPEVTTSHAPLWHPLFGSQKTSLNSPWSWTTVTVNGE